MMKDKVRFWIWINDGPARLTLASGQHLEHFHGGPTDEGYSREYVTWTYDGRYVYREWESDGRDCDGRLSQSGKNRCAVEHLADRRPFNPSDNVPLPDWEVLSMDQRDYSAEAMGY